MNSDKETSYEPHISVGEPSSNRRNLLKAAASMAPFVGTLPSGAALANASSVQCAIFLQGEAAEGRPIPISDSPDHFYRVPAKQWTTRIPPNFEPGTVYQFTPLSTPGASPPPAVRVDGSGNALEIPPPPDDQIPSDAVDVYLLTMYVPVDDPANVPLQQLELASDNITPATCNIPSGKGFSAPPGTYCIYPIAPLEGGDFGNLGMSASCLTSFVNG
jgi:hypothetical protein